MYYKYYGFKQPPFSMTPDSRFFFESPKHMEALSTLVYAISERKGFVVITGEIGAGKTTVCRALLNRLEPTTQTALITNTHITTRDMLTTVLEELGVEYQPGSKARLLSQLNAYLIDQLRNDCNVVLIIDEAQNLKPSVLEEVRMLSNLETEHEKLIQIIFLGQPELRKKLGMPKLEQLRQRIAVYYHLMPLTLDEAKSYILHRLKVASDSDRKYFTDEALNVLCEYAKGVPRIMNQVADSALLNGFIYERPIIEKDLMNEVISESPTMKIMAQTPTASEGRETINHDDLNFKF